MRHLLATGKRRPPRHSVRVDCQVVRQRDFTLVADGTMNLSLSGALFGPADPVVTGESLLVSFRLPGSSAWIDTEGHVARVVHGRRPGEYTRALGVTFAPLSAEQKRLLKAELERRPPVPPSSRPGRRNVKSAIRALIGRSGNVAAP